MRTLSIPEIAKLRPRLVPELAICGSQMNDDGEIFVSGIADAVAYDTEAASKSSSIGRAMSTSIKIG